ncbi:DUF3622 domain-containing protein [Vibrio sp. 10N.222.54.F12]|jgi:hypothetical protein|uniref:DUF3622 domain-containing protein n=6 Tax=Vibrio TaxID=662 RepID=A0A2N7I4A1_9VIBR|nr:MULTISPECIES: DUF3622 domain-containing protein [Vibrio]ARP37468.1 hypothetical protein K08M4_06850 [Vibrio syngnathi]EAQ52888.1 Pressure-regulated ORF-like protein [Vibrio sp. MED222]KPL93844.1 hypothetical protein AN168_14625 [Vibrio splendidus]OEF52489.1 hypothetical protein A163_00270 [Vibrio tasmaniensis 1F-267]OEF68091.1 hypothetical protein A162_05730 [Vibrio tasmaniensis 1F-155]
MSKNKKFDIRLTEKRNGWCAEITRQVTSRSTTVSKRESGFETEALAQEWAEKELASFIANQAERNERKSEQRKERDELRHTKELKAEQAREARAKAREEEQEDAE